MFYITLDKMNIFIINYKCCYSSFEYLVQNKKINKINYRNISLYNNCKYWIVTRNPYNRFISFYKDKFINSIKRENYKITQNCQLKMLNFFEKEKMLNLEISISDVIFAIKKGYWDIHLSSQNNILKSNFLKGKDINFLKLESKDFNDICLSLIGSNIPKVNVTNSDVLIKTLTEKEKSFLYKKYEDDFLNLSYDF